MILLVLGCHGVAPTTTLPSTDPAAPFAAADAEAARLVRDPARGGPALPGDASPLPPFRGVDRGTARYLGPAVCAGCHAEVAATWGATAHAHAMDALVERQRSNDPRCFRCHVTGYGSPSGYGTADAEPGLGAVGCEACHGPGSDHVAATGASRGKSGSYGELPTSAAACTGCHTWENSPDYLWATHWPRIAHGG